MSHAQHGKEKLCLDIRHSFRVVQREKMIKSKEVSIKVQCNYSITVAFITMAYKLAPSKVHNPPGPLCQPREVNPCQTQPPPELQPPSNATPPHMSQKQSQANILIVTNTTFLLHLLCLLLLTQLFFLFKLLQRSTLCLNAASLFHAVHDSFTLTHQLNLVAIQSTAFLISALLPFHGCAYYYKHYIYASTFMSIPF